MATRLLKRAGVSNETCEQLKRHHIESCKDLLSLTPIEVMHAAGMSYQKASELLQTVSKAIAPPVSTALELWTQHLCFSTSLPALDKVLRGGLPYGTITEVTGPSGCGKTQLCMMLSLFATLPKSEGGMDSDVIYIDTECAFSAERLVEIAQSRFPDYFSCREKVLQMAGRVHLFRELTCQDVLNRLERLEEDIISNRAGLIILDSVASVVRKEFDTTLPGNLMHRSNLLSHEASTLKYLAHQFNIPVVLTNQITTHVRSQGSEGESGFVTAALGNTWSHSVNTRLIVQYVDSHKRQILIAKSPVAPFAVLNYTIEKQGICIDADQEILYKGTDPGLQPIRVQTEFSCNLTRPVD
ncbi:DNA repair protein RAD51 homolog 2-like [Plectropomus leopardus]|uniref:DNA repair protein RAD51 homolog 2-like n=1 Tax=Plectropomus leopardus TaxID=160734 RepID=UPI001C4C029C|nr:DNA repair protein RAD51 homolog 2-like [Plectropomus leopardus]XP_042369466.1 DNA repair protein RAD51 homolog 2-like [Plectropomus leopardus]